MMEDMRKEEYEGSWMVIDEEREFDERKVDIIRKDERWKLFC